MKNEISIFSKFSKISFFETKYFFEKNIFWNLIFIRIDLSARETFKNGVSFHLTPSETGDTVPPSW